ncbi:MAG: hydrogen gas-evolving membrane-bound hydrogenase subunit E [Candidatus Hydrothermarchaeales archaeon]
MKRIGGRRLVALVFVLLIGYILVSLVAEMPRFGDPNAPAYTHVVPRYVTKNVEETGALNIVASIIADYRAYDTLGEATVLYTAALGVISILALQEEKDGRSHH